MKKVNSILIATIIATFIISMIAFQPTATEASNNVVPTATPSPRKIRKTPRQDIEVENDETHRTRKPITKVKTKKPAYKEGGVNDTTHRTRMTKPKKPNGFQEVSGIGMEVTRRKSPRRNSAQYNPKELGIDKIKAKKPVSFTSAEGRSLSFELRRKNKQKRKN